MKKKRRNLLPVKEFRGKGLRWEWRDGVVELTLDHDPLNEIGTLLIGELEQFAAAIDTAPFITLAAVHGLCMGGGLELALLCDLIVADKMARFGFPELRLGFIPGFGGIPRLRRDVGNSFIRDLLFTGRTVKAEAAHQAGLIAHLAGEGYALEVARSMAQQISKFDPEARVAAKKFVKPIPHQELREEVELFCKLFNRPQVMESLRRFVESDDPMKHLPASPKP